MAADHSTVSKLCRAKNAAHADIALNQLDQVSQNNASSSQDISSNVIEISGHINEVEKKVFELNSLIDGQKNGQRTAA